MVADQRCDVAYSAYVRYDGAEGIDTVDERERPDGVDD